MGATILWILVNYVLSPLAIVLAAWGLVTLWRRLTDQGLPRA